MSDVETKSNTIGSYLDDIGDDRRDLGGDVGAANVSG